MSLTAAAKKQLELVSEAARLRTEIENQLRDLEAQVDISETTVADLERRKDQLEKEEKSRIIRKQPLSGKAGVLAGLAKEKLEQWKKSVEYLKQRRDEEAVKVSELELALSKLRDERNPSLDDEAVQRAVTFYDDYSARAKPYNNEASERDTTDLLSAAENGIPWSDFEAPDDIPGELETLYAFEAYLPFFVQEWIDSQLRALRVYLVQNGVLADKPASNQPEESQPLKDARKTLQDEQNELNGSKRKKTELEESLAADFGPDGVFRTMKDRCISTDVGEYTYELCWMGQVTQKPKKGGMNHNIGRFNRFEFVTVDEDVTAEGRGLGVGERLAAKHEGGGGCWNGPARSSTVIMACAQEEEIWKVMEEEKCVYRLEVGTPAVCTAPKEQEKEAKQRMGAHGEL